MFKRWWSVHFRKPPTRLRTRVFAATAEMVLELAERGIGVGVVPRYLVPASPGRLHVIEPTPSRLVDHLWLIRRRAPEQDRLGESFVASVEKWLRCAKNRASS
jgi:DNA-binding transcriptional LysR family regulator